MHDIDSEDVTQHNAYEHFKSEGERHWNYLLDKTTANVMCSARILGARR